MYYTGVRHKAAIWNFNFGPKYIYGKGRFRPSAEFGIGKTTLLGGSAKIIKSSSSATLVAEREYELKRHYISLSGAIGCNLKVRPSGFITFRLAYDWNSSIRKNELDKNKDYIKSWSCKVGYAF